MISKPEGEKVEKDMQGEVTAEAILRSADGSSILEVNGAITAENIEKYRVGKEVNGHTAQEEAQLGAALAQHGLAVEAFEQQLGGRK